MDPALASVAAVGFAASLTTLTALVIKSSQTLYRVRSSFKNAPQDVRRLCRQFHGLQGLLQEVQQCMQEPRGLWITSNIQAVFTSTIDNMHDDLSNFQRIMVKLEALLNRESPGKTLTLRIRRILQEDVVQDFQRQMSSYVGTLTLILVMVNK